MKKYYDMLATIPFFDGIGPEDLEAILPCLSAREESVEKGEILFRQGEKMEYIGIVLEGSLSLEREDFWGNRSILAVVERGRE